MVEVVHTAVLGTLPGDDAFSSLSPARKLNIAEAREKLAEIVNDVAHHDQTMIVMRRGKEMAALIPIAELKALRAAYFEIRQSPADSFTYTVPYRGSIAKADEEKAG